MTIIHTYIDTYFTIYISIPLSVYSYTVYLVVYVYIPGMFFVFVLGEYLYDFNENCPGGKHP